jgi:sugar phosphate isomerase/epimerase
MNRRSFLITAGLTAATPLVFGAGEQPATKKEKRFKFGAYEGSLGKNSPESVAIASKIGLDGFQPVLSDQIRDPKVQKEYLDEAGKYGLSFGSLGLGVLNSIPLKSDPKAIEILKGSIPVAQALKINTVMIAQFGKGDLKADKPGVDRTVEILKEHLPEFEKAGITVSIENTLTAADNLDILQRVGSKVLKVYYDVGNSIHAGYDIYKEIRMLKGNVCEFHFKDGKSRLGHGKVDFNKVKEAMDEIEYSGWIQLESSAPNGVLVDYKADLEFLKTIFKD